MARILKILAKHMRKMRGLFPMALPKGVPQREAFCDFIFSTYDLPDLPSYRHSIYTMVMHLDPTVDTKAPLYFAKSIRKAMANQTAYDGIQKIREEEKQKESASKASSDEAVPE